MKFRLKRNTFLTGVQKTLGIVEKKTTSPILNNVLFRAKSGQLQIIATDMEMSLTSIYDADIIEDGEITLSAKKLYEMIREIQGEDIQLGLTANGAVKITSQKTVFKIPTLPAADYPSVTVNPEVQYFNIPGAALRELITKTSYAMETDGNAARKNLNGVYLETELDGVNIWRMVATDGYRLSKAEFKSLELCADIAQGVIIPQKGLMEIKKLVEGQETVVLGMDKNAIVVKTSNTTLKVNLVDDNYPDYKRVIPSSADACVTLDKAEYLHALKRMSVVSSDTNSAVKISIAPGKITLNSVNVDIGEATEELTADYEGDEAEFEFNVNYLIDSVTAIATDKIILKLSKNNKPGVVLPMEGDNHISIVMPLLLTPQKKID
jgi:DNA polymerase-3 subunit beta